QPRTAGSRAEAYEGFHKGQPTRWTKAPATIDHRFLNEDVPYGLVAIAELGHVAQVPMPCADAVIEIASIVAGRSYRRDGLTRDRMGIGAMTVSQVTTLLRTGTLPGFENRCARRSWRSCRTNSDFDSQLSHAAHDPSFHHIAHAEREMGVNSVAVLGAGHGGCAAAADLGKRGYSVRLHARNPERLAPLRAQGGIEARGIEQGLV